MSGSIIIWLAWAIALFWATGAYNRLVRLRAQAIGAFAELDAQFCSYVALVRHNFADNTAEGAAVYEGLLGAVTQFDGSLKAARGHPLDAMTMRALAAAHEVLSLSWARLRNEPGDLAGAPLPETLFAQWQQVALNVERTRAEFNQRVQAYNQAIRQFPARVLAWLFGFKAAHEI